MDLTSPICFERPPKWWTRFCAAQNLAIFRSSSRPSSSLPSTPRRPLLLASQFHRRSLPPLTKSSNETVERGCPLRRAQSVFTQRANTPFRLLLAQSGHRDTLNQCPLLEVKRTLADG